MLKRRTTRKKTQKLRRFTTFCQTNPIFNTFIHNMETESTKGIRDEFLLKNLKEKINFFKSIPNKLYYRVKKIYIVFFRLDFPQICFAEGDTNSKKKFKG